MDERQHVSASDIPAESWIDRVPGAAIRPYLRLARMDRPIGTWLLLLPCWWSLALAAPLGPMGAAPWPDPWFMALFAIGALVMRGAGCTVNDIADRDFDAQVARTADRPIASGQVSVVQALAFLGLQSGIGLAILLQFNDYAVVLGASSLLLVAVYPFAKRVTYWPQLVLGLTFNWGALLGWAAVTGGLAAPAIVLYAAGVMWTLGYDTIYAHQDKEDDALVGIKSTARLLGTQSRPWIAGFYTICLALLTLSGWMVEMAWPYWIGLAIGAAHLVWQTVTIDFDDPKDCLKKFRANRDFGLIIFVAAIAARALV